MRTQSSPAANLSFFQRAKTYFFKSAATLAGYGSAVPNVQYSATFPYSKETENTMPTDVSFSWLSNLSPGSMFGAIYNGVGTIIVSGTFGYRYTCIAAERFVEEFRHRRHTKRFKTAVATALLSGLGGGAIASGPFVGALAWGARLLGFTVTSCLSFLGTYDLSIKLSDEDYAFKLKVLDHLRRLRPEYQKEIQALLDGQELNEETLKIFLNKLFDLAVEKELQREALELSLCREWSSREVSIHYGRTIGDYTLSGTLTGICSFVYLDMGFNGTNALTLNHLDSLPVPAKIVIGVPAGLPLMLFVFFTVKLFESPMVEIFPEIKDNPKELCKAIALIAASDANAKWYYGMARMVAKNSELFAFLATSTFGQTIFPWAGYLVCLTMGVNGLAPMVFPPKINKQNPTLKDVIKTIEVTSVPPELLQSLAKHSFFMKEYKQASISLKSLVDQKVITIASHL